MKLKTDISHLIQVHDHAFRFLKFAKDNNKRIYLVTNAHRKGIKLKMKMSKIEEAYAIQKPILCIRIHGKNFSDQHRKMYFNEFKNWYFNQEKDEFFINNRFYFIKKLLRLYIIALMPKFLKDLLKKK